jgi:hypothetical protein
MSVEVLQNIVWIGTAALATIIILDYITAFIKSKAKLYYIKRVNGKNLIYVTTQKGYSPIDALCKFATRRSYSNCHFMNMKLTTVDGKQYIAELK